MNKDVKVLVKYILKQQKEIVELKTHINNIQFVIESMDSDMDYISRIVQQYIK